MASHSKKKSHSKPKKWWHRISRATWITICVILVLLIGLRLALPSLVKNYVNRKLDQLPDYGGSVRDVDINLIRGAYSIEGVDVNKTTGKVPVPFFSVSNVDFSLQWKELIHGALVSEIYVDQANLNFVKGPTPEESQTAVHTNWLQVVKDLVPFRINHFEIRDSKISYHDEQAKPKVDIYLTNLFMVATNLTNARDLKEKMPAWLEANGVTLGKGKLHIVMRIDPFAERPTFDLNAALEALNLVDLNNFLRAYANVDVNHGIFQFYTEIASENGRFEGYVKPLLDDLVIVDLEEKEGVLKKFWEMIVAGAVDLFKNHPKDRLGTKIPFTGEIQGTNVDIFATVGNLLKNGFVRALSPSIDTTISPEDLRKKEAKEK